MINNYLLTLSIERALNRIELSLPLLKNKVCSMLYPPSRAMRDTHTFKQGNYINASVCFSSLPDILRSIDTFTMLCSFLKNPFVVTTFINSMLPRFKPSPLSKAYIIKQNFKLNKEKKWMILIYGMRQKIAQMKIII